MILLSLTFTTAKRYNTCFFSRGIQAVEGSFTRVETKAVRAIRRLNAAVPAGLPPLTVVSALGGRDTPALRKEPAVTTIVSPEAQTNHTAGHATKKERPCSGENDNLKRMIQSMKDVSRNLLMLAVGSGESGI